jgi:hypothetical protein
LINVVDNFFNSVSFIKNSNIDNILALLNELEYITKNYNLIMTISEFRLLLNRLKNSKTNEEYLLNLKLVNDIKKKMKVNNIAKNEDEMILIRKISSSSIGGFKNVKK